MQGAVKTAGPLRRDLRRLHGDGLPDPVFLWGAVVVFALTYFNAWLCAHVPGSDYYDHLESVRQFSFGSGNWLQANGKHPVHGSYPMWHVLVWLAARLGLSYEGACGAVTAAFAVLAYVAIRKVLLLLLGEKRPAALFALAIQFAGVLYYPGMGVRLARRGANVWRSPTQFAIKPFAVVVFFYVAWLFIRWKNEKQKPEPAHLVLLAVLLFFSALAKPAFLQAFLPALILFLLIELIASKGKDMGVCVRLGLAFVPCVALMGFQFLANFDGVAGGGANGVQLALRFTEDTTLPDLLWRFLVAYAFPVYVCLLEVKRLFKDKLLWLAALFAAVGYLEPFFLHEVGERATDGNFAWARSLGLMCLWVVCAVRFMQRNRTYAADVGAGQAPRRRYAVVLSLGWVLVFWHVLGGVYHYYTGIDLSFVYLGIPSLRNVIP